jgi:L-Ala-D/L-Glu epimerase
MKMQARTFQMHLIRPFRIARIVIPNFVVENVILELSSDGLTGLGEAAPQLYYEETGDSVTAVLPEMVARIPDDPDPALVYADLVRNFPKQASARNALDTALYDLLAKRARKPLSEYLGLDADRTPVTSFTIGIDTPEVMRQAAAEVADRFAVLKIKVGLPGDLDSIRAIREVTDLPLRVDANCGWSSPREALERLDALAPFNIQFCEQPIRSHNLDALREIHLRSPIPIMADEDAINPDDVDKLAGCVWGINVKLTKCGGVHPALLMLRRAKELGMRTMLGCMIESSVGITAAAHLTPLADYADLDGNILVSDDPYRGVLVQNGKLVLPSTPGLGITPA